MELNAPEPVVIGALGGSGTRVLADALADAGVHLGQRFNRAHDNLVFTALFKRPRWYASAGDAAIHRQLDLFVRHMRDERLHPGDYPRLIASVVDHDPIVSMRVSASRVAAARHRRAPSERAHDRGWGWKEPNTHIFLPQLIDHFPNLKFVYLMRHGLDMAFGGRKMELQVKNWGSLFGVPFPDHHTGLPRAQLEYWITMTRRATQIGRDQLGERFLLMRYDQLCSDPAGELERLFRFAGLDPDPERLAALAAQVEAPPTVGRWRSEDTSSFSAHQIEAVRRFGFAV